jgi:hypothetical protein
MKKKTVPVAAKKASKKTVPTVEFRLARVNRLLVGAKTFLSDSLTDKFSAELDPKAVSCIRIAVQACEAALAAIPKA